MASLLFAQGWACPSPAFAQPQAVERLLFNPERAEAQSPAHLHGGIGPEILSQGFARRAISKGPFLYKRDLPGPILSYHLNWFRDSHPPKKNTTLPKKDQKAGWSDS